MKVKKIVAFMTLAAIVLSTAGCGTEKTATEKPNELTLFAYDCGTAFKDDYPTYVEAEKMTGIHIKGTMPKSTTDHKAAFNMMMASGNLADIILTGGRSQIAQYGKDGAFIPLNNLIDKYAPNIKKVLEENEDIKNYITANDGNIYFIPFIPGGEATMGWFIRQDWLDKLGLEQPKTVEEFYNVMIAFKTKDPNGNGKADEIPYFNRNTTTAITDLYSFWGMNGSFFVEDGKVKYSPLEDNFVEATKTIANWYKEGLIDVEIYTRGGKAREYMLGNDIGGITHDWFSSTAGYNDKLTESIPGINFKAFAPPAGVDGKIREFAKRQRVVDTGYVISSSNKHPEASIEWMDFWFSPEGSRLMNYGIEGEDYTIVDGKPIFTEHVLNNELSVAQYLQSRGSQGNVPFVQDFEYEKQWTNAIALEGIELYVNNQYFTEQYVAPLLSDEDQKEYDSIMTNVKTLTDEKMQKWILGSEDVEVNYEQYLSEIKTMGIERAIELIEKYYK